MAESSLATLEEPSAAVGVRSATTISRHLAPVFFFALLALAATIAGWLPGRTLAPTGIFTRVSPWGIESPARLTGSQRQSLDWLCRPIAWTDYVAHRLRYGHADQITLPEWVPKWISDLDVPAWCSQIGCGMPVLAAAPVGVFFPTIILHMTLSPPVAWTVCGALQLFLAGVGAWRLGLRLGLASAGAVLAGAMFLLSGASTIGLSDPAAGAALLLPWAMLAADWLMLRITPPRIALLGIAIGLQFLCGDLCAAIICTISLFAFVALRPVMPKMSWRRLLASAPALLAALASGLILSAWQNLPRVFRIVDGAPIDGFSPRYAYAAMPWAFSLFRGGILPALAGITAICLAIYGILATRCGKFFQAWLGVGAISAMGLSLFTLPVVSHGVLGGMLNSHDLAGVALALAMLAGGGIDALFDHDNRAAVALPLARWTRYAAMVFAAAAIVGSLIAMIVYRHDLADGADPLAAWLWALWPAAAAWGCSLLLSRQYPKRLLWPWLALALVEQLAPAIILNHGGAARDYFPTSFLLPTLGRSDGRIGGDPGIFPPAAALEYNLLGYNLSDARGINGAFPPPDWMPLLADQLPPMARYTASRLLNVHDKLTVSSAPTPPGCSRVFSNNGIAIDQDSLSMPRAWLARRAEVAPNRSQVLERMRQPLTEDPRQSVLIDQQLEDPMGLPTPPGYFKTAGFLVGGREEQITITRQSNQAMTILVRRSGGGWLVIADRYDPGWRAQINGRYTVMACAYGLLQCVPIPAGTINVHLTYESPPIRWGMLCSFLGLAVFTLLLAMGLAPSTQNIGDTRGKAPINEDADQERAH